MVIIDAGERWNKGELGPPKDREIDEMGAKLNSKRKLIKFNTEDLYWTSISSHRFKTPPSP